MYKINLNLTLILLLFIFRFSRSDEEVSNSIRLVIAVSRHGERTPADTYPNDPYVNHPFYPFGWGQLTNNGKRQQYELGKFLRRRYGKFLGDVYSANDIIAQSTDTDRSKMSAQLQLTALFPPVGNQIWNHQLSWQPIPVNYQPLNNDTILLMRISCPRYYELQNQILESSKVKNMLGIDPIFYELLTNITGLNIRTPDDVQSLYSTLKAEEDFGLIIPRWISKIYQKLIPITMKSYVINAFNLEMRRLKSGLFIKEILENFLKYANKQKTPRKLYLYAGHDSTVSNLLLALNVWDIQMPVYNIMTLIELHENSAKFFVKILFRNGTRDEDLHNLKIPFCGDELCELYNFADIVKDVIPKDILKECQSHNSSYIPPAVQGP